MEVNVPVRRKWCYVFLLFLAVRLGSNRPPLCVLFNQSSFNVFRSGTKLYGSLYWKRCHFEVQWQ